MFQRLSVVLLIFTSWSCGPLSFSKGGRGFPAAPAIGGGVRIDLKEARGYSNEFTVTLRIQNDSPNRIVVNRNQLAIVGPDGRDQYRYGDDALLGIDPAETEEVTIELTDTGTDYMQVTGVWLRFDGVWSGGHHVELAPMRIGEPSSEPGSLNTAFRPPRPGEEDGMLSKMVGSVVGWVKGDETLERRKLRTPGQKLAALPLKLSDIAKQVGTIMDELFLAELESVGFDAVGPEDINTMVGLESMKDSLGCDEAGCMAEIGNALGVRYLASGTVGRLEGDTVLALKLIDVGASKVLARANRIAKGGTKVLPRIMAEAVQELVTKSGL